MPGGDFLQQAIRVSQSIKPLEGFNDLGQLVADGSSIRVGGQGSLAEVLDGLSVVALFVRLERLGTGRPGRPSLVQGCGST
jgi:hypothetical protein